MKFKLFIVLSTIVLAVGLMTTASAQLTIVDMDFETDESSNFIVRGDGRVLWKSKPVFKGSKTQRCSVKIDRFDVLELAVHCPGHNAYAHSVWLESIVRK